MSIYEEGLWGTIAFALSVSTLVLVVLLYFILALRPSIGISRPFAKLTCVLFVLSLSALSYYFVPHATYDLTKHFYYMDEIRSSPYSFAELITQAVTMKHHYGHYPDSICFNILRDILIAISDNNSLLPVTVTFIVYAIVFYISLDYFKLKEIPYNWMFITLVISFSTMPLLLVVSGIRAGLAFTIAGLAVYLREIKKKSWVYYLVLSICAVSIHTSSFVVLLLYVLAACMKKKFNGMLVFAATFFVDPIMKLLSMIDFPIIQTLTERFFLYRTEKIFWGHWSELLNFFANILFFIVLLSIEHKRHKRVNICGESTFSNYITILAAFSLGTVFWGGSVFLNRVSYIAGSLAAVFMDKFRALLNENKLDKQILVLLILGVFCANIVAYMINYISCLI